MAESGELVLVNSYHFDDMCGSSRHEGQPIPIAMFPRPNVPRKEGICYLDPWDFMSYTGYSSLSDDRMIAHLQVHSNCSYDLRRANGRRF